MRPQSAYQNDSKGNNYLISQKQRGDDWSYKVGGRCKELANDQAGFMADMTSLHFSIGKVDGSEDSSAFNCEDQAG